MRVTAPMDETEPTEEIHSIVGKTKRGKFHRFVESYEMAYGDAFYLDLQKVGETAGSVARSDTSADSCQHDHECHR